jgi:hypothetical protein
MTTMMEMTLSMQDGMLKAIESSQAWTLGALSTTTSAFDGMAVDPSQFPMADKLPSATDMVESTFGFAQKLLDNQKAFVAGLVDLAPKTPAPTPVKK